MLGTGTWQEIICAEVVIKMFMDAVQHKLNHLVKGSYEVIWVGFEEKKGHSRQRNALYKDIKQGMSMWYSMSREEASQTRESL